jgi:spore coat protein U-like protein
MSAANIGFSDVYGLILRGAAEVAPPGTYLDTVLVTVDF